MTRQPAVAGMFYPKKAEELIDTIKQLLKEAEEVQLKGKLRALIVPHAGYIYSGPIAAVGYKLLKKYSFKKVVLLGPCHYKNVMEAAIADEDFLTPLGTVKIGDIEPWLEEDVIGVHPEVHAPEHSLEVQLPFLQETLGEFELYALAVGVVKEEKLAKAIKQLWDEDTLIIVSSDLSHYLSYDKALFKDNDTIGKIMREEIVNLEACGQAPIHVLQHIAKAMKWKPQLLDYRNSGDTAGEKDRVVGYAAIAFVE